MELNGSATIEVFRRGKCIQRMERHNLVVSVGEDFYTQSILPGAPAKKIQYMQLGRGGTAPTSSNTQLATSITGTRETTDTASPSGRTGVFVNNWGTSAFSATGVKEAGLFSQLTSGAGTMLARVTFTSTNKTNSDTFKVTWKIAANDDGV